MAPHHAPLALRPHPSLQKRRSVLNSGFTLIELMIVVAVVSILAAIAYPSYMSQARKSRRADAVSAISAVQQAEERWRANNPVYTATIGAGGLTGVSATSSGGYYTLEVSAPTEISYTLTATAAPGKSQTGDTGCTALVVTVTRGNGVNTPAACWSK